ncbi:MAG: hypothetical protein OZSIB_2681 [Candidatus Ozemobacter sibiricus]|uniref:HAMP domain-containing protein n=1 Tax=Candidatus Ozemobacter sibiricus TaxID=2268124 RepID=A0A367ZRP5_9BACT|nr:MAG: hypothetical protein OZSIB_2681 [Candidatus Ozemobacter sibiricus]
MLPSYQIRLVGFLILVILLGTMIHGFFLYKITARTVEEGFFSAHNRLRSTWEILKPAIIVTNGISFLLISLALLVVTTLSSHRLIGPVVKIAGRLRDLAAGRLDLPPLRLRADDEGQILSEAANQVQETFRQRLQPLAALRDALAAGKEPDLEQVRAVLDQALAGVTLSPPAPGPSPEGSRPPAAGPAASTAPTSASAGKAGGN